MTRQHWNSLLVWLVLSVGLAATYFLQQASMNAALQIQQENFEGQTREIVLRIRQRLEAYEHVLHGTRGLFAASSSVERGEFHRYALNLQLAEHYPGIQGVGFSLIIQPQDMARHITAIRKEGYPDYTPRPAGERDLYTSIIYLEPFAKRNLRAFGYDMYSEPVRRTAMERARDSDNAATSGKVKLVQEEGQQVQPGFLMYLPVYRNDKPHETLEQRRSNIIGWVYAPFRTNDLMQGILGEKITHIDYEIYDGKNISPDTLLFDNDNHLLQHGYNTALYRTTQHIDIAGHTWTIKQHSLPDFEANIDTWQVNVIRLTGILMSALLALLVWLLINGQTRALKLAQSMTQELRISETSLREAQSVANMGSYILDTRSGLWQSSDVLDQVFGIDSSYPRTVSGWKNLIHPDDRAMMEDYLNNYVLGRHQAFDKEYRIIRHNDQVVCWVHGLGNLKFDDEGNIVSVHGTIQNITPRKRSEETLLKLSLAVEQSPNSIVITDLNASIEYVNSTFTSVTGYSQNEVLGQNPRILQSGKTPMSTYTDMWAHLARGELWHGELINRRRDGSEYVESVTVSPVRQTDGRITNYLAVKQDITENKKAAQSIEMLAHFDQLTGLPNRSRLVDRFKYARSLAQRNGESLAVMFLDLDHFKNINDTLGHSIGDQLLMEVATRLKQSLREEDTVSRMGGDEFVLIIPGANAAAAAKVASKLIEAISRPWQFEQHELIATPSIGIAIYPNDGEDFETLSKNADTAMYRVKKENRNDFRFFTPEMQATSVRTMQLSNALRHALQRNELMVHYQPQISMQDGRIVGAEALLRWTHPELGAISPAEFIPIAEENGQIIQIGEWVLRTATQQLKNWIANGLPPMVMAVNLSAVQFHQANVTEVVNGIIDEAGLPHHLLEVELTEAVAMHNPLAAIEVMNKLHESGIRMSIDDFGTGYSSLNYLKKFKVYKLKIDQSFVRDITDDPDDKAIVTAIINMASSLGIHTIAEGVETSGQLAFLRLQGCNEVQGYYFSKPLAAAQFETFVKNYQTQ